MAETTTITTAMLQNLLPNVMFPKGYANGNLDDLKTVGLYQIAPEKCSGLPDGIYQYGVMKVYSVGGVHRAGVYLAYEYSRQSRSHRRPDVFLLMGKMGILANTHIATERRAA